MPLGVIVTNTSGNIIFINKAFTTVSGYGEEVIGCTPAVLKSGQQPDDFYRQLWSTITAGQTWDAEIINRRKDGSEYPARHIIIPIRDADGKITNFIGFQEDLTRVRTIETELRRSQRLDMVGKLTGGVAHDFNNLLTVVLGNAELLEERLPTDSPLRPLAEMARKAAEHGAELTQRLLAFARRQPLCLRPVDVTVVVSELQLLLHGTLGEQIKVSAHLGAELWEVLADAAQLESALLNLCVNARDAMPRGGRLTIEASNAVLDTDYAGRHTEVAPGDYVMIAVSDNGQGMDAVTQANVFEPFFTTKSEGKGSGLGLSMVHGFVKQVGGHVNLYSEPGRGTTVRLYLPRAADTSAHYAGTRETDGLVRGSERILVVEDDELVRAHAITLLGELGYEVIVASNGPEAIEVLRRNEEVDLLFTDIVMPGGLTGVELAEAARTLRPGLSILYTSGYTEGAMFQSGDLGPDHAFLQKPYRRHEIAAKVRAALDQQPAKYTG